MPIIAKQTGSGFIPCPAGLHHAVCVDAIDLGKVKVSYDGKEPREQDKVRLAWQTDEPIPETGKPYIVHKRYTRSLNEKATLRKDLESWRSKPLSLEELNDGFDLELLIGVNCQIAVIQEIRNGSTYANVTSVVPPPKGAHKIGPRDYTRVKDRSEEQRDEGYQASDEDIPF